MRERIDIIVPDDVLGQNEEKRRRLQRTRRFEKTDRVPVEGRFNDWGRLAARGRTAADYFRSPADNLREQLLNLKWQIENIRDDMPIPEKSVSIAPDLGCLRGVEFPMDIVWPDDGPPKCTHPLTEPEQIDRLEVPPPEGGLNARYVQWVRAMREAAETIDLRLNGSPLEIRVTKVQPGGPIPAAFALAGQNLFLWMMTDPDRTHRLMEVVTTSHIQCIRFFDEMFGREARHSQGMGADTGELLGPDQFREFVVPYYLRVWNLYEGQRGLHMCGKIDHLLPILRDELGITMLNGFGFPTDRRALGSELAGRVIMSGGPNPVLIRDGSPEAIVADCMDYIDAVGRQGGYILKLGGGSVPGTPPENVSFMVEASERSAELVAA